MHIIIRRGVLAIAVSLMPAAGWASERQDLPRERVYHVGHTISAEGARGGKEQYRSIAGVSLLRRADGGQRLVSRTLWSSRSGDRRTSALLSLDPDDARDRPLLELLTGGFQFDIDARGVVRGMRAVDQRAWSQIIGEHPGMAQLLMPQEQLLGMRPMALPSRLRVGQRIVTRNTVPQLGVVEWRAHVRQLDEVHVLLDMEMNGELASGRGRQVVTRADGLPVEGWLELDTAARDGMPATRQTIYLADIATARSPEVMMDLDGRVSHEEYYARRLAEPPFSGPSEDPALFELVTPAEGGLAWWMSRPELLARLDRSAGFAVERRGYSQRSQLRLGGQLAPRRRHDPDDPDASRPEVEALRVRGVDLLDGGGRPLAGLQAVPTTGIWDVIDTFDISEDRIEFPFRLPLSTTTAQRETIDRIVVDAQVEVHRPDGSEHVATGAQPRDTAGVRLEWIAPQRLAMILPADAGAQEGVWVIAVPLDAGGRQLPSSRFQHRPPQVGAGADGLPVLEWQRRQAAARVEIAASGPIASVLLQRYRWQWQDHAVTFANIGGMRRGGPLVRSIRIDEPPPRDLPSALMEGGGMLARIGADGPGSPYRALRIDAPDDAASWIMALCRVESSAPQGQARARVMPRHGGAGRPSGWMLELDGAQRPGAALPPSWPVTADCPASVQHLRSAVADAPCFSDEGDGWLQIRPACRGRVPLGEEMLIGRDAEGQPLARLPAHSRGHHLRFWGELAEIDYVLGSGQRVQRDIEVPLGQ